LIVAFARTEVKGAPLRYALLLRRSSALGFSGAGRSTPRERARHYTIARGSAVECLACLDLLELETAPPHTTQARAIVLRLLNVLTALIRRPV